MPADVSTSTVITPEALLAHWQGHRRVTRRVIAAFPPDEFQSLSLGGMRPFSALAREMIGMLMPTVTGVITGEWSQYADADVKTQEEILAAWDQGTAALDDAFPKIPLTKFGETVTAFGQWTMPVHDLLLYVIDNEIHHRGQGYVYLRALGIEPPAFYDRS
ncbi:MAG: DinB family protein [Gemmatimonadota bacterium]